MYVVYAKNHFTLLGKEYFGTDGKKILGFHDPSRASHFKTKKEAQEFCKLFDCQDRKIEPLDQHLKLFNEFDYKYRELPMLNPELDYKYDPEKHDAMDVLKWELKSTKAPEKSYSYETYRTWPDLCSVFKHLHGTSSYYTPDHKSTMHTVDLKTCRDGVYEEFLSEFRLVLDYCNYIDEEGRKIFPIFEHELNQYERRRLAFGGEENCAIEGRYSQIFEGTLKECFEEMKKHYWY